MDKDLIEITTSVYKNNAADYSPPHYFYESRESEANEPAPGWNIRTRSELSFFRAFYPYKFGGSFPIASQMTLVFSGKLFHLEQSLDKG